MATVGYFAFSTFLLAWYEPRSLHSAVPCGFYILLHQPSLHFLIIPQHLKKTQCRQWSGGGISHSVTAYQPRFTSTSSLTHHWCKQENRLLTYQHWKLMNCSVSCVTWTFTMAVTLLSVFGSGCIINYLQLSTGCFESIKSSGGICLSWFECHQTAVVCWYTASVTLNFRPADLLIKAVMKLVL